VKSDTEKLKDIVKAREISYLVHFTRLKNLDGILEHGIVTRSDIDQGKLKAEINDNKRLDGWRDSISLSITFPNDKMFYKYRCEAEIDWKILGKKIEWVVLLIHKSILWKSECAFCKQNAADHRIRKLPKEQLSNHNALNAMFDEIEDPKDDTRERRSLKPCYPTDPQAEVLVFDTISPKKILGLVFNNETARQQYRKKYPSLRTLYCKEGTKVFGPRN